MGGILQLVHQQMLPPARSLVAKLLVSEKYIVALLRNFSKIRSGMYELIIEVRSTADFNVTFTVKDYVSAFNCFMFSYDKLTIQVHKQREPIVFK